MPKQFLNLDNQKIAYFKEGSGPALLILHGWGISSDNFKELQHILSKNFTVYNIDFLGFGGSSLPERPFNVSDYKDLIKEFIKKLEIKEYYILAHSFGGRVAIKLACENPKELKGLILTGAAGISRKTLKRIIFVILAKIGKRLLQLPLLKRFSSFFRKILYRVANESDYSMLNNKIMQETFKKVVSENLFCYLNKIKVKTLLLWGRDDKMTPLNDGIRMNKEIKSSKLVVFDNIGHRLPYAKPEAFSREIVLNCDLR